MMPVASNDVLIRLPRPTELRRRLGVVRPLARPLLLSESSSSSCISAIAAIAPSLNFLFRWICGVSCSSTGANVSTLARPLPFALLVVALLPAEGGRDELAVGWNWKRLVVCERL